MTRYQAGILIFNAVEFPFKFSLLLLLSVTAGASTKELAQFMRYP